MTPKKKPAKADRTPQGDETQEQADRRADDQDAAMEAALLAGSLPDEDRRVEPVEVEAPKELTTDERLAMLPVGSKATFTRGEHANQWRVEHGNGPVGESKTLARAIRLINAQQIHAPDTPAGFQLIDIAGATIGPD